MIEARVASITLSLRSAITYIGYVTAGGVLGYLTALLIFHCLPISHMAVLYDTSIYLFAAIGHFCFTRSTCTWPMIEYGSIARTIGYSLLFIVIGTVMIWIVGGQWERIMGDFNDTTSLQRIHASVRQLARNKNYIAVFVLLLNVCGIAPTVEELVFRSGLYRILKGRFSTLPAAGISSALFATYHVSVSEFVPLLLFGYLCCWAYEKTGDIRGPIFFHAGFNILGFLTTI